MSLTLEELLDHQPEMTSYRTWGGRGSASERFHTVEYLADTSLEPAEGTLYVLSDELRDILPKEAKGWADRCAARERVGILLGKDHPAAARFPRPERKGGRPLVVEVDTPHPPAQLCIRLLQRLERASRELLEHITQVNIRFTQMSLKEMGIEAMVSYFKEVIGNPVAIYDETFRCVSSTDACLRMHSRISAPSRNFYLHNLYFSKQKIFLRLDGQREREYSLISFPISFRGKVRAYLSILEVDRSITDTDCLILEMAASAILTEMKHTFAIRSVEERNINRFLYDLFYRGEGRGESLLDQAAALGVVPGRDHLVLVLETAVSGLRRAAPRTLSQVLGPAPEDEILALAATRLRELDSRALVGSLGGSVIAIYGLEGEPGDAIQAIRRCCRRLGEDLGRYFKESTLRAGVGSVAHGILEAAASYQNALNALAYSKLLSRPGEDMVVVYEDSLILRLVSGMGSREALEEIVPQSLRTLKEYDRAHQTGLLDTLEVYFRCNGNARQAAAALFIHHKTMLYRLNKLSELCGIDLSDSEERLRLALGLKILGLLAQ